MNVTCPNCLSHLSLEALAEDADARKLFGLLSQHEAAAGALVQYLQLFKAAKQALRWSRALRLAQEVTAMVWDHGASADELQQACVRTVSAMQAKRSRGDWRPLMSHGYFERVLAAVLAEAHDAAQARSTSSPTIHAGAQSKRAAALRVLDED